MRQLHFNKFNKLLNTLGFHYMIKFREESDVNCLIRSRLK